MTAFKPIRLTCSHGPDLHFEGRLVHEYSTQNKAGTKDRWQELRLWETPAGNWIAEIVGMSTRGNEGVIREARVIQREERAAASEAGMRVMGLMPSSHREVMETFNWSTAAKAFAREMRWDVVLRVE